MDDNRNLAVSPDLIDAYFFRLPRAYHYADYVWPGLLMSPQRLDNLKDFAFRPSDILIASYPKSGTTWVSEIVSLIVHQGNTERVKRRPLHERVPWLELDQGYMWVRFFWIWQALSKLLGVNSQTESGDEVKEDTELRRVFFTHLPVELLPRQAIEGVCKIIYVARNPKDNAVSFFHFHQMARFLGQQKTTWEEFFALYSLGKLYSGSWFEHVLGFWELSKINDNVVFLKYEDMKKDLFGQVQHVCKFLDIPLSREAVHRVVSHCQFESMKGNKMTNREGVWLFNQKVSNFMRKGVVGDWKNYFTVAQNEMFDEIYKTRMKDSDLQFPFDS